MMMMGRRQENERRTNESKHWDLARQTQQFTGQWETGMDNGENGDGRGLGGVGGEGIKTLGSCATDSAVYWTMRNMDGQQDQWRWTGLGRGGKGIKTLGPCATDSAVCWTKRGRGGQQDQWRWKGLGGVCVGEGGGRVAKESKRLGLRDRLSSLLDKERQGWTTRAMEMDGWGKQ